MSTINFKHAASLRDLLDRTSEYTYSISEYDRNYINLKGNSSTNQLLDPDIFTGNYPKTPEGYEVGLQGKLVDFVLPFSNHIYTQPSAAFPLFRYEYSLKKILDANMEVSNIDKFMLEQFKNGFDINIKAHSYNTYDADKYPLLYYAIYAKKDNVILANYFNTISAHDMQGKQIKNINNDTIYTAGAQLSVDLNETVSISEITRDITDIYIQIGYMPMWSSANDVSINWFANWNMSGSSSPIRVSVEYKDVELHFSFDDEINTVLHKENDTSNYSNYQFAYRHGSGLPRNSSHYNLVTENIYSNIIYGDCSLNSVKEPNTYIEPVDSSYKDNYGSRIHQRYAVMLNKPTKWDYCPPSLNGYNPRDENGNVLNNWARPVALYKDTSTNVQVTDFVGFGTLPILTYYSYPTYFGGTLSEIYEGDLGENSSTITKDHWYVTLSSDSHGDHYFLTIGSYSEGSYNKYVVPHNYDSSINIAKHDSHVVEVNGKCYYKIGEIKEEAIHMPKLAYNSINKYVFVDSNVYHQTIGGFVNNEKLNSSTTYIDERPLTPINYIGEIKMDVYTLTSDLSTYKNIYDNSTNKTYIIDLMQTMHAPVLRNNAMANNCLITEITDTPIELSPVLPSLASAPIPSENLNGGSDTFVDGNDHNTDFNNPTNPVPGESIDEALPTGGSGINASSGFVKPPVDLIYAIRYPNFNITKLNCTATLNIISVGNILYYCCPLSDDSTRPGLLGSLKGAPVIPLDGQPHDMFVMALERYQVVYNNTGAMDTFANKAKYDSSVYSYYSVCKQTAYTLVPSMDEIPYLDASCTWENSTVTGNARVYLRFKA